MIKLQDVFVSLFYPHPFSFFHIPVVVSLGIIVCVLTLSSEASMI